MAMTRVHTPSQAGFSLVELMVALLLGVVLTSGVISVFITSKTSYSLNNAVGQVQEAGRFAMSTIQPIVAQAGAFGCANPLTSASSGTMSQPQDLNNPTGGPVYDFSVPVYGFEYTGTGIGDTITDSTGTPTVDNNASDWTPNLTSDLTTALNGYTVQNSDILLVHEELGNPAYFVSPWPASAGVITMYASTTTPPMSAGDIAIASNCKSYTPFQISASTWSAGATGTLSYATSGTPGNSQPDLGANYQDDSQVGAAQTYVFFVGKSQIDGGYSLFEASLTADTGTTSGNGQMNANSVREIVPGVENMQVLYGVAASVGGGVPAYYTTADQVGTAWNRVVSVRIALMVRSDDNAIPKEQAPTAATSTQMLGVGAADSLNYYPMVDRRLHRYFVETISLRNTMP